jgi:hypothetical protein
VSKYKIVAHVEDGYDTRDADIQTLDIEYDELAQAWKLFQESLPPSERITCKQPRTADDVIRVVLAAEREWASSKHKARWEPSRLLLNRFCATLPSHSAILSAFGYGDEYVNLFYDVLKSIIKVGTWCTRALPFLFLLSSCTRAS